MELIERMNSFSDLISAHGVAVEEICSAEMSLKVTFAKEYEKYLSVFGVAAVNGHELTGICECKRVNVVSVTIDQRERFSKVPPDWYVVEEVNIDGVVIWQSGTGEIYQTIANAPYKKINNSLCEYIEG